MPLSDQEVIKFATAAVEYDSAILTARTDDQKAKLLAECRQNAKGYYEAAQAEVKASGYRVTQRVKDILWRTLVDIESAEKVVG